MGINKTTRFPRYTRRIQSRRSNRAKHVRSTSETIVNKKQSQFGDFVSTLLLDILVHFRLRTFWFILGSGICCCSRLLKKSKLQCEVRLYHGLLVHSDFLTCLNRASLFRNSANLLFADQDNKIFNSSQTLYATIYALAVHYSSCLQVQFSMVMVLLFTTLQIQLLLVSTTICHYKII